MIISYEIIILNILDSIKSYSYRLLKRILSEISTTIFF